MKLPVLVLPAYVLKCMYDALRIILSTVNCNISIRLSFVFLSKFYLNCIVFCNLGYQRRTIHCALCEQHRTIIKLLNKNTYYIYHL